MQQQELHESGITSPEEAPATQEQIHNTAGRSGSPRGTTNSSTTPARQRIRVSNLLGSSVENFSCSRERRSGNGCSKLLGIRSKQSNGLSSPAPYLLPKAGGAWKNRRKNESPCAKAADLNILDNPGSWPALASTTDSGAGNVPEVTERMGLAQAKAVVPEEGAGGGSVSEASSASPTAGGSGDWASVVRQHSSSPAEDACGTPETVAKSALHSESYSESLHCKGPCRSSVLRPLLCSSSTAVTGSRSFSEILGSGSGDLCRRAPSNTAVGTERGRTPRSADDVWRRDPVVRANFQEPPDNERSPFDIFRAFRGDFGSSSTPAYPRRPVNLTRMQSPARSDTCYEENLDVKDGVKKSYEIDKMSDAVAETLKDFYTSGMEVHSDNTKSGLQPGKSLTESPKKKSLLEKEAGECALAMMSASKTLSEIIQENLRSKERDGSRMAEEKPFGGKQSELRESYCSEPQYNLINDSDIQKRFFLPHLEFCEDTCPKKVTDGTNFNAVESQCCLGIGQHPIRILSRASAPNSSTSEEKRTIGSTVHQKQTMCPRECLKCVSDVDRFLRESLMCTKSCNAEEHLIDSNTENPFCVLECKNLDLENKQISLASRNLEKGPFDGQVECQTVKLDELLPDVSKSKIVNESMAIKEGVVEIERDDISNERAMHEEDHLAKGERSSEKCEQIVEGSSTMPYSICKTLEVTIPEDNGSTVTIPEQKTQSPKSHTEVTVYARHQTKGEKGLLQIVPGKPEDAKTVGRNPLQPPRFTKDTKLKKQGTAGKKASVKAVQDTTPKSKTSSLIKNACSEGDNLSGYLQQLHISSVLSDGSKQVSRSAEHSSTSSEDHEVSVKSTDSSFSCGGAENNSRSAQEESAEKNCQHVAHSSCRVAKKQEVSAKKTTGTAAGSGPALVHTSPAPKPAEAKFRPDCRASAFASTYQRGRRKLPVISTKYRYVASQRTTRTEPTYRHQHQSGAVSAPSSGTQKSAAASPGSRLQSPACSDSFSGAAAKGGASAAGSQVLLKSSANAASKGISGSSQPAAHKSVEQGARSPYKKDNTLYPVDSAAVDIGAGRKKTTLRKTTLIRHPRSRAQMPMVRSAQYTNSSFEEDPKMCYTMGDGRKIVFSPNAVNTPLTKAKKVREDKSKPTGVGSNAPSNDTEEVPSGAGKEAVKCNAPTEVSKAAVKESKAQSESRSFDTLDKYSQETAQQSPQKAATAAAAPQCSRGAAKHPQDASALHAVEEMLLAPASTVPVPTNNFQASYGGPAAKPRLYREPQQQQQQQQQQQHQQQQQQQQQQHQQQQQQQLPYGAETYPDHYPQSFPDGRLSLFDPVPNRCGVQSSGIRQGHYLRDDVQPHPQHFSSSPDIRTNRTLFDASVNLLTEASVLGGCATAVRAAAAAAAVAVSSREQYHLLRCEGCSATVPVLLPSAPEEILTCSSLRCLVQSQTHFGIKAIPTHAEPPLQLFTSSVGLVPVREVPVTYPISNASIQQPFLMDLQQFVQLNDQQHNMITMERIFMNDMPASEPAQRAVPVDRNSARFGDTWTPFGHPPLPWHDWSQYSSSLQPSDFAMPEAAPGIIVEPQQPPCSREQSTSLQASTDTLQLAEGNNSMNAAFYPPSRRSASTPSGNFGSSAELLSNKNFACINVDGQYYS